MNYILIGIIVCLVVVVFRLSGRETYKKWSGGVFYILSDGSLVQAEYNIHHPMWEKKGIRGILIAGVKKETMPFVDYLIWNKTRKEGDFILVGRRIREIDGGVQILFSEVIHPDKFDALQIEVQCPYGWEGKDNSSYAFYTVYFGQ